MTRQRTDFSIVQSYVDASLGQVAVIHRHVETQQSSGTYGSEENSSMDIDSLFKKPEMPVHGSLKRKAGNGMPSESPEGQWYFLRWTRAVRL